MTELKTTDILTDAHWTPDQSTLVCTVKMYIDALESGHVILKPIDTKVIRLPVRRDENPDRRVGYAAKAIFESNQHYRLSDVMLTLLREGPISESEDTQYRNVDVRVRQIECVKGGFHFEYEVDGELMEGDFLDMDDWVDDIIIAKAQPKTEYTLYIPEEHFHIPGDK